MARRLNATGHWTRWIVLTALSAGPQSILADAWTQPAGRGQITVNMTSSEISHEFNGFGNIWRFPACWSAWRSSSSTGVVPEAVA